VASWGAAPAADVVLLAQRLAARHAVVRQRALVKGVEGGDVSRGGRGGGGGRGQDVGDDQRQPQDLEQRGLKVFRAGRGGVGLRRSSGGFRVEV